MTTTRSLRFWVWMIGFVIAITVNGLGSDSQAAGKPPAPSCGSGNTPPITTPIPIRNAVLQPVGAKAFQLPNGVVVDIGADLQSIWNTVVTSSNIFAPTDPSQVDPCNTHIEIRAAVSTFQLNIAQVGITFGFNPAGQLGPITSITGQANVSIGAITMDFSTWSCVGAQCSAIVASNANQVTAGANGNLTIDFNIATTSAAFVFNTPIAAVMRSIMVNGMNRMIASSRLNALPWQAQVRESIPSAGLVIFDAGAQYGIGPNQAFEIYAPADATSTGVCNVYQVIADIHTTAADTVSSTATVDQMMDSSRGILPGDVVMIRTVSSK